MLILGTSNAQDHDRAGHPETSARLAAVMAGIGDLYLGSELVTLPVTPADLGRLTRVHAASYLDELAAFCDVGGGDLDPDTYATATSWSAAREAAGAGLAVIDALGQHHDGVGFVAVRPPGHHALDDRAMGFCLINNIAVAAAELTSRGERVLIVDWDVHHGNGTQTIFWDDPDVLYVSTHQWPLFPGTGEATEIGGPHAIGRTLNVPVPAGATGDVLLRALGEVAQPVIESFAPTWVLVSAGFDAHRADPLADLRLTSGDFAAMARLLAGFAPGGGRLVLFLEGGYDLAALRLSVATTISALLGDGLQLEEPTFGGPGREMVERARTEYNTAVRLAEWGSPKGTFQ